MLQGDIIDFTILTPLLSLFILLILVILMIYLYVKVRKFVLILPVYLFSLIFGMMSIQNTLLPFTPYFQIFIMVFQSVLFLMTVLDVVKA